MNLTRFEDVSLFLKRVRSYWLEAECFNSLTLGICDRLLNSDFYGDTAPLLLTVEVEGTLIATAVRTPPHDLILYTTHSHETKTMNFLASELSGESLTGAFGQVDTVLSFAKAWQMVTSRPYQLAMKQRIYELRQVTYKPDVPGHLRPAAEPDYELLAGWMSGFNRDAFGETDQASAAKQARRHLDEGNFYIWDNGRPVSVAAKTRKSPNGRTVSLVYTPPEQRGKGFASACVAALSQRLLDDGYQFCTLFTDLANPTSNSIYQRIGYKPVADLNRYRFTD